MTTTEPTLADEAAYPGTIGSPLRMAALSYLGARPEGCTYEQLIAAMRQADRAFLTDPQLRHIVNRLRADGRIAWESTGNTVRRWYSPAARQAAAVRGQWRPPSDAQADAAATQAAGAIARARGLATDPTAD